MCFFQICRFLLHFQIVLCIFSLSDLIFASDEEYRLLRDLRRKYDPYERPVSDSALPLNVSMKLYLQQILDVVSFFLLKLNRMVWEATGRWEGWERMRVIIVETRVDIQRILFSRSCLGVQS